MPKGADKAGRPQSDAEHDHLRTEPTPPLDRLNPERLGGFLELALDPDALLRLCKKLGLSTRGGYRLEKLSTPEHADLLADEYVHEARVRPEIDEAVLASLKGPALRTTWLNPVSAREIAQLVAGDPIVASARLAWRYIGDGDPAVRESAERAIDGGLAILDDMDDAARAELEQKEEKPARPAASEPATTATPEPDDAALREELEKRIVRAERDREAARAQLQQARAEVAERDRRLNELKGELSALRLETAKTTAQLARLNASRTSEERKDAQDTRRVASERAHLEKQLGDAREELEAERKRARELEQQLQERPRPVQPALAVDEGETSALDFTVPNFTREFYESLEGWDRRVVKVAFEKAMHLARDHRHPSLRALQLEGIDNYFRIRIASDVRLIYRRAQDGRLDILSLIDREDLDRYIRQAKTRRES